MGHKRVVLDVLRSKTAEREAYSVFELGDFVLREGATLRGAKLAYKTWGTMCIRLGFQAGIGRMTG
jgi:homoserine acetyltransferase